MTDIYLTLIEADKLIEMKKRSENPDPVESPDSSGRFQLDTTRARWLCRWR